jgi:hypothetical protein
MIVKLPVLKQTRLSSYEIIGEPPLFGDTQSISICKALVFYPLTGGLILLGIV